MALSDTDLLLVQRGNQPYRETYENFSTAIRSEIDPSTDIPIASASQLGVIRVGNNLQIDAGTGILDAVVPAGLEYKGTWNNATTPPSPAANGDFYVWNGGDGVTLSNALWGTANNVVVNDFDRLFYDGTTWDVVPTSGGAGGGGTLTGVTGTLPIVIGGTAAEPDVTINPATTSAAGSLSAADKTKLDGIDAGAEVNVGTNLSYTGAASNGTVTSSTGTNATIPLANGTVAGLSLNNFSATDKNKLDGIDAGAETNVDPTQTYTPAVSNGTLTLSPGGDTTVIPLVVANGNAGLMSGADKNTLDSLVASPGGVVSITAGDGIEVTGTAGVPIVSADFGATPNGTPTEVMPYDISLLGDLP